MKISQQEGTAAIDQAIEWIERLRSGDKDAEGFLDWLSDSPRHVEVFMQAMTLEQRISTMTPEIWAALDAANPDVTTPDHTANVVPLSRDIAGVATTPSKRQWPMAVAAAVIAVAIGSAYLFESLWGWRDFVTAVGEQRTVQLEDGSVVNLNTGSHVKVRLSAQGRDIRLLRGEALFKVQHDGVRPFRVHTHDAVIQALGTQFNVYRRSHETTVSVLEGRVRVDPEQKPSSAADVTPEEQASASAIVPTALSAGEQADVGRNGQIRRRATLNTAVTAWQQRRLIFDEETLTTIASEFNRYNQRRFEIKGAEAGSRRFSGIFDADDPESLAQLLARDSGLTVERAADEIVVRARP